MSPQLQQRLESIRTNTTAGSRQLVLFALDALAECRFSSEALSHFLTQLRWIRPAMAAFRTISRFLSDQLQHISCPTAVEKTRALIQRSSRETIQTALQQLPHHGTVATISYSSLIEQILVEGIHEGKQWNIYCFRSGTPAYGEFFQQRLHRAGIPATVLPDAVPSHPIDFVLIGADTVSPSYGLINGHPSYSLCALLFYQIPIYCCAESFKYDASLVLEPGFDFLPASFGIHQISDSVWIDSLAEHRS